MRSPWRAGLTILMVVLALAAAGCSSSKTSSSSDSGAGSQFCQLSKQINDSFTGTSSTTTDDVVKAVKAEQSKIDDFLAAAPSSEKANAQTLHDAAAEVISSNSVDPLKTDAVSKAGDSVDAYCGTSNTSS